MCRRFLISHFSFLIFTSFWSWLAYPNILYIELRPPNYIKIEPEKNNMKAEKRHKLQLYHEILAAIEGKMSKGGYLSAKPTHIQQSTHLSYDTMLSHFDELEKIGMIVYRGNVHQGLISITQKGKTFVQQYSKLVTLIESAGL